MQEENNNRIQNKKKVYPYLQVQNWPSHAIIVFICVVYIMITSNRFSSVTKLYTTFYLILTVQDVWWLFIWQIPEAFVFEIGTIVVAQEV